MLVQVVVVFAKFPNQPSLKYFILTGQLPQDPSDNHCGSVLHNVIFLAKENCK